MESISKIKRAMEQESIHLVRENTSLAFMFPQTHDTFVQELDT
jgi:hypothetical protein